MSQSLGFKPKRNSGYNRAFIDGKLTSRIFIACLVPVVLVVLVVTSVTSTTISNIPSLIIIHILTAFEVIVMILFICYAKRYGLIRREDNDKRVERSARVLKIIFTWIFGIVLLFSAALFLAQYVIDIIDKTEENFGLHLFINTVEISALCLQLVFVTKLSTYKFKTSIFVNLGMSIMLSTQFMWWCQSIMSSLLHHSYKFQNATNRTTFSEISTLRQHLLPFIHPTKTEYNLLIAGFLITMWSDSERESSEICSSCSERRLHAMTTTEDLVCVSETTSSIQNTSNRAIYKNKSTVSVQLRNNEEKRNETTPLLTASRSDLTPNYYMNNNATKSMDQSITPVTHKMCPESTICIVIALNLLFMSPLIAMLTYLVTTETTSTSSKFMFGLAFSFTILMNFTMTCIALYKVHTMCTGAHVHHRFKEKQYILTISTSGAVVFNMLLLMAGFQLENLSPVSKGCVVSVTTLNIFVIFLQTILIIHSEHVKLTEPSPLLEQLCVALGVMNFVYWLTSSFFTEAMDDQNASTWIANDFYHKQVWDIIMETIFPFNIFYRFHCFMEMYERYKDFQHQNLLLR